MIGRRNLFLLTAGATLGACTSSSDGTSASAGKPAAGACGKPAAGPGLGYCVVESKELVFPGAARLGVGEVMLRSLDDQTAAIVARDERGFYALSAICTHACCTVSLCGAGADCRSPTLSPRDCGDAVRAVLASSGPAFLCPCHGSTFSADGTAMTGPALRALPPVTVRISGDDLIVDLSAPASVAQRT